MSEEADAPSLLDLAEDLYGLPLGEFTASRDALVKQHRGSALARDLKALRKPTTAAWVVDLLVRHETEQVEQVLSVGAALREAQASMSADELRTLTKQRRQLTAAVTTTARGLAREHGLRVTEAVAEQVQATLTAAMVDADCARAVRSGLLVAPLETTGVDDVDVAAALALPQALGFEARAAAPAEAPPRPELHVVPDPEAQERARAEAEEALEAADEELARAREAREEAGARVEELEARGLQVQSEIDELRRRLAELESTSEDVDDELGEAEDERDEAQAALEEAEAERDRAARALTQASR
ncbi:vacuolar-type H+-ATPase subunit I/STV1 [Nocardioides marinisabuli]|uniref:Vacuolar-type H+-ATPase subunit I/STV1 n=1 Tax=Nocardioides marinisabuli TaxID=419476 RepID=A0A7Y9F2T8_9ACTN|nr:hypothetical protein [Nocardioides marinisabuli]NYD58473.1 vacuolar-type H+-ATPase subunit I/STV1 [Nocardioides marinisabuli]